MSNPILPLPQSKRTESAPASSTGEGALTALAAMIRKRKLCENHVDIESPELARSQPAPDA